MRRDETALLDGAVRLVRYEAEGAIVLGAPPVLGWFDPDGFRAPLEQFRDPAAAAAVGSEALRVAVRTTDGEAGRLAAACLLDDHWSRNLWSWLAEQLPKALLLEAAGFAGAYLVPPALPAAREALLLAGIAPDRIVGLSHRLVAVDRLTFVPSLSQLDLADVPWLSAQLHAIRQRVQARAALASPEIVFVQYGDAKFLKYAYYQALAQGYDAVVLGDEAMRAVRHARIEMADPFSAQAARFATIYRHLSVNGFHQELLCFQRWFVLRDYMAKSGRPAILLDHDILAYPGVHELARHAAGHGMMDTTWTNFIPSADALDEFCRFVWDSYSDPAALAALAARYRTDGKPQLSDMVVLVEYRRRRPDAVAAFGARCVTLGFDNNIRAEEGYVLEGNVKAIEFVDGRPFCTRADDGTRVQFHTFHCQGLGKPLMERLHTITEPHHLAELEPLGSEIFDRLGVPAAGTL